MKIFGGFLHFSQLLGKMLQNDLLTVDGKKINLKLCLISKAKF